MRAYSLYHPTPVATPGQPAPGRPLTEEVAPIGPEPRGTPDRATMARALAELEAAKQRVERDAQQAADELRGRLVLDLLPLLDDLDRTIAAAQASGDAPAVVEGVQLVRAQFQATLDRQGVTRIEARHRPFDPALHEAVSLVPVTHPSGHGVVIDQLAPGYKLGDRLLRPARVVVGRRAAR